MYVVVVVIGHIHCASADDATVVLVSSRIAIMTFYRMVRDRKAVLTLAWHVFDRDSLPSLASTYRGHHAHESCENMSSINHNRGTCRSYSGTR